MAAKVFGKPVTGQDTKERAHNALINKNAGNKQQQALDYVKKLKQDHSAPNNSVCTLVAFYNATGEKLEFVKKNSKFGDFSPDCLPPSEVQNGEWGCFVHVQSEDMPISQGFVIYQVVSTPDVCYKELLAWKTTSLYTEHCDIFNAAYDPTADVINDNVETNPRYAVAYNEMFTIAWNVEGVSVYVLFSDDDVAAKEKFAQVAKA